MFSIARQRARAQLRASDSYSDAGDSHNAGSVQLNYIKSFKIILKCTVYIYVYTVLSIRRFTSTNLILIERRIAARDSRLRSDRQRQDGRLPYPCARIAPPARAFVGGRGGQVRARRIVRIWTARARAGARTHSGARETGTVGPLRLPLGHSSLPVLPI